MVSSGAAAAAAARFPCARGAGRKARQPRLLVEHSPWLPPPPPPTGRRLLPTPSACCRRALQSAARHHGAPQAGDRPAGGGADEPQRAEAHGPADRGGATAVVLLPSRLALHLVPVLPCHNYACCYAGELSACHKLIHPPGLQLLATAGHVALYDFDIPTKRWVRCALLLLAAAGCAPPPPRAAGHGGDARQAAGRLALGSRALCALRWE